MRRKLRKHYTRKYPSRKVWDSTHKHLSDHIPVHKLSSITANRLLSVSSDFLNGAAHWRKIYGIWSCIGADQPFKWMVGKTPSQVHLELLRLGVDYRWEGLSERMCGSIHGCRCSAPASTTNDAAVRPTDGHSGSGISKPTSESSLHDHGTLRAIGAFPARPVMSADRR